MFLNWPAVTVAMPRKKMEWNTVRIVDASVSDAQKIAELSNSAIERGLELSWSAGRVIRAISRKRTRVLIAKTRVHFAGFGIMDYFKGRANLSLLAVEGNFRRRGVGSAIVSELQDIALDNEIENIYVQVRERNSSAIRFYENMGFEMIDVAKKYYQKKENAVIMYNYLQSDVLVR